MSSRLQVWEAIEEFIDDLADVFADKIKKEYRCLGKYKYLVSRMTLSHKAAIDLHIEAFRKFCVGNREALKSNTVRKLTDGTIKFSDSCYIPVSDILAESDDDLKKAIWRHLHVLSARTDPEGKIKDAIIKEKLVGGEGNFLKDILTKAEACVDKDNDNPMAAIMSMMQGGVFTDLFNGMTQGTEDGSMDPSKLVKAAQGIISTNVEGAGGEDPMAAMTTMLGSLMGGEGGEGGDLTKMFSGEGAGGGAPPNIMNMLGPLMSQIGGGAGGGENGQAPDLMGMLGRMGGGGGGGGTNIQDSIDIEVARARRAGKLPPIEEE